MFIFDSLHFPSKLNAFPVGLLPQILEAIALKVRKAQSKTARDVKKTTKFYKVSESISEPGIAKCDEICAQCMIYNVDPRKLVDFKTRSCWSDKH